jgi:thiol-disulfide isomerase/thioredoxin
MSVLPHCNYYLSNFDNNVNSRVSYLEHFGSKPEDAFIMFYAPWCGHCKNAEPHFDRSFNNIAVDYDDYLQGNYTKQEGKLALIKVNGDKHPKLCEKMGVNGFPTFKYITNINDKENLAGANIDDYGDPRNQSAFEGYCKTYINQNAEGSDENNQIETFSNYTLDYDPDTDLTLYN